MFYIKPNHICKYSKCTLGENGSAKTFYACDYCDRINSWKTIGCCKDHYDLYIQEVLDARAEQNKANLLPQRTDKTKEEVIAIFEEPIDKVLARSKEVLKDYMEDNSISSIQEAVDKINDTNNKPRKNKKQ